MRVTRINLADVQPRDLVEGELVKAFDFYRGRTALYALLRALEVGPGDEVIVQGYTCLAVILPIIGLGAVPVYVDVLPANYSTDPASMAARITSRTRAIIIQHTFGIPAALDQLLEIAREHRLPVIEDCCHVHGGMYRGRPLGSFGAAAFYSFHWSKPVAGGRGGLAVINDSAMAARVAEFHASCSRPAWPEAIWLGSQYLAFRLLRSMGLITHMRALLRSWSPNGVATGQFRRGELEYKLTPVYTKTMAAPLKYAVKTVLLRGRAQIERRQQISAQLHARACQLGISPIELGTLSPVALMSYPLHANEKFSRMSAEGRVHRINVTPGFVSPVDPLGPNQWADVGYHAGSCPVAEYLAEKTITLPVQSFGGKRHVQRLLGFLEAVKVQGLVKSVGTGMAPPADHRAA